ncbi:amino acid ABC transporter ATP-binding protein [Boudabousia liubingyangii]|uniref:amino acid ABC transporter ATP-binding protein n=1 Tax=Boudabousia liubingyangii TaxID=1921764 RepID=UPI0009FB80B5|nr:amino acid ABC transporter ATP-binding protein [Boudabousia liubingyangii]
MNNVESNFATPSASQVQLEVKQVNKSFGATQVLNECDLSLSAGEVGVLWGPSGTGKTTLMRCIAGLETVDSGEIWVNGIERGSVTKDADWHRQVGMVFQGFNLFPHRTALENVTEALIYAYGEDPKLAQERGRKLLTEMGLADRMDAYPGELSGGQQQRVAIARSCALEPKVLCFDEPTSALDEAATGRVVQMIKDLAQSGMTILVITHDRPFADAAADRLFRMDQGRILPQT